MSKSANMLRTRRKDNNVKPNRRLDRKSSRGMLYENEELRLKTININAEVERGQSDIKKLKRENDQLRREIWYLRDEYDKLDKLLREKEHRASSSSSSTCSSDSESDSSCTNSNTLMEASQNLENVQNLKKLHEEYDHLSVVPEENSTENSDKNSCSNLVPIDTEHSVIQPDQSYPAERVPKHFFSPIKPIEDFVNNQFLGPEVTYASQTFNSDDYYLGQSIHHPDYFQSVTLPSLSKTSTDVIVKTDNQSYHQKISSFSNGGNLEELLNDIESISHDILKISHNQHESLYANDILPPDRPYKSELNVVLIPSPMELIEIEKYNNIKKSCESLQLCSALENASLHTPPDILDDHTNPFCYENVRLFNSVEMPHKLSNHLPELEICTSKTSLLDVPTQVASENEENLKFKTSKLESNEKIDEKLQDLPCKTNAKQKVSIHFKGTNKNPKAKQDDKPKTPQLEKKQSFFEKFCESKKVVKTPSVDSKNSAACEMKNSNSESRTSKNLESSSSEQKSCIKNKAACHKSSSASPERKHPKKHKKHKVGKNRKNSLSAERLHRERSYSVCTDRSNILDRSRLGLYGMYDDFTTSDRERTNSLSSCDSLKGRKLSTISHFHTTGKIPWCGCWGNGCL